MSDTAGHRVPSEVSACLVYLLLTNISPHTSQRSYTRLMFPFNLCPSTTGRVSQACRKFVQNPARGCDSCRLAIPNVERGLMCGLRVCWLTGIRSNKPAYPVNDVIVRHEIECRRWHGILVSTLIQPAFQFQTFTDYHSAQH